MLGRETVVNGDHRDVGLSRDLPADHVVRLKIADDPAAAVEEDERRQQPIAGSIEPHRNRTRHEITYIREWRRRRAQRRAYFAVLLPRFRGRDAIDWRSVEAREVRHDVASLRVERVAGVKSRGHIQRRYQTIETAPK